jgi:hypothetical protein
MCVTHSLQNNFRSEIFRTELNYNIHEGCVWMVIKCVNYKLQCSRKPSNGLSPVGTIRIQSQSYFTTGGLPPISSFWRQAP